jgi:histone deacetylase 11
MRWATAGTILGATLAFQHRLVFNLSGGYHHASAEQGEGFSIYNDIALAIHEIRREGLLGANERIAYVDCDAHQGNAVCHAFFEDPRVFIYDCYNPRIYPVFDVKAKRRIDCNARVLGPSDDSAYLQHLQGTLPSFLDGISRSEAIRFAIYNAGTDVLAGDMLGMMNVTENGVLQRDIYVIDQLLSRGMAVLVLPSGGYTRQSYRLIANTLLHYLQRSEP